MSALPEAVLLDTSVLLRLFHDHRDPPQRAADHLRESFAAGRVALVLLDLSVYELVNILVRRLKKPARETVMAVDALFDLGAPIVAVDQTLAGAMADVAVDTRLSAYDAAFVAAARSLALPLVTGDRGIVERAGAHGVLSLEDLES